jgi:hypothetical protein
MMRGPGRGRETSVSWSRPRQLCGDAAVEPRQLSEGRENVLVLQGAVMPAEEMHRLSLRQSLPVFVSTSRSLLTFAMAGEICSVLLTSLQATRDARSTASKMFSPQTFPIVWRLVFLKLNQEGTL